MGEGPSLMNTSFLEGLSREIIRHLYAVQWNNKDFYPFPLRKKHLFYRVRAWLRDILVRIAAKGRFTYVWLKSLEGMPVRLCALLRDLNGLEETYDSLSDEWSRELMLSVLAYRVLGRHRVRLPTNTPEYWGTYDFVKRRLRKQRSTLSSQVLPGALDYFELDEAGFPLRIHSNVMSVAQLFLMNQYAYERDGRSIQPEQGDVVIDGGACWGDSSLCFAHRVGPEGHVYAVEFVPGNLEILGKNLSLNPELAKRVTVVCKPFWSKLGRSFSYSDMGPSTKLESVKNSESGIAATTVDHFVQEKGLRTVDLIKLDVEGAELEILKGARETLRTFRPKLAISVYHQDDDLVRIPQFIRQLGLSYSYCLDHYTIYTNETVLYARAVANVSA